MKKLLMLLATLATVLVAVSPVVAKSADTGGGESPSAEEEQCWLPEGCEEDTTPNDQYPPDPPVDDQYPSDPPAGGGGGESGNSDGSGSGSAAETSGGILPDTGGASLMALGAGPLLIGGGPLARRLVR